VTPGRSERGRHFVGSGSDSTPMPQSDGADRRRHGKGNRERQDARRPTEACDLGEDTRTGGAHGEDRHDECEAEGGHERVHGRIVGRPAGRRQEGVSAPTYLTRLFPFTGQWRKRWADWRQRR